MPESALDSTALTALVRQEQSHVRDSRAFVSACGSPSLSVLHASALRRGAFDPNMSLLSSGQALYERRKLT
jgi:hypothetical protein